MFEYLLLDREHDSFFEIIFLKISFKLAQEK